MLCPYAGTSAAPLLGRQVGYIWPTLVVTHRARYTDFRFTIHLVLPSRLRGDPLRPLVLCGDPIPP